MTGGSQFRYRLEIGGVSRAAFLEVTGLGTDLPVVEHRDGVGPTQSGTIALKRGIALNSALQDWYHTWIDDETTAERHDAAIILVDEKGADAERWQLSAVRPITWIASDLEAEGNITAIETLELRHRGVQISS